MDDHSDLVVFRKEILDALKKVADKRGVENVLGQTPKFMAMLKTDERRIKRERGIKHRDFWRTVKKK